MEKILLNLEGPEGALVWPIIFKVKARVERKWEIDPDPTSGQVKDY